MTLLQISKVWTVVSLFLLYYALNTYIVVQGGSPMFGATLIVNVSSRIPAAMMGIPICSVLLILSAVIGIDHARKGGPYWADRIPLVGFESIDTGKREAKIYQGVMLFLLSVLPVISLIHFWKVFCTARLVTTKNPPQAIDSIWSWKALVSLDDPARICTIFREAPVSCDGNITVLPGLEPTLFAIVTLAAVLAVIGFWVSIFRKRSQPSSPNDY